jgi:hypothetical protein
VCVSSQCHLSMLQSFEHSSGGAWCLRNCIASSLVLSFSAALPVNRHYHSLTCLPFLLSFFSDGRSRQSHLLSESLSIWNYLWMLTKSGATVRCVTLQFIECSSLAVRKSAKETIHNVHVGKTCSFVCIRPENLWTFLPTSQYPYLHLFAHSWLLPNLLRPSLY